MSRQWRKDWSDNLFGLAASLALYGGTPLDRALSLSPSVAQAFLQGREFAAWTGAREADAKIQSAIVDRLNAVIRGLNVVARVGARR